MSRLCRAKEIINRLENMAEKLLKLRDFPGGPVVKNANTRDVGSTPGSGRSPGGEHGNPLKCSFLENPMDRGAWRAAVHRVAQSGTLLKGLGTRA